MPQPLGYIPILFMCYNLLQHTMERVMGIEPTYSARKADILPLNHTRILPDSVKDYLAQAPFTYRWNRTIPLHSCLLYRLSYVGIWWAIGDSNPELFDYESKFLPIELMAQIIIMYHAMQKINRMQILLHSIYIYTPMRFAQE